MSKELQVGLRMKFLLLSSISDFMTIRSGVLEFFYLHTCPVLILPSVDPRDTIPEVTGYLDRVTGWRGWGHSWRFTRPGEWRIYDLKYATAYFIQIAAIQHALPFAQIFHAVRKLCVWKDILGNLCISRRCDILYIYIYIIYIYIINASLNKLWNWQLVSTTTSLVGLRTVAKNVVILVPVTATYGSSLLGQRSDSTVLAIFRVSYSGCSRDR